MEKLTCLQLRTLWEIKKKPICGYNLMKMNGNGRKITQGTMYPLLQKLERTGLVVREKGVCNTKNCKCKKRYMITEKGKKVLDANIKEMCAVYNEIFKSYVCKKCGKSKK